MAKFIRLPRIMITNDDGIDAPGLAVLEEAAREFAEEIWVIAPVCEQSGASQSLSCNEPLRFSKRSERRWAVRGTPSDCVALACGHLMSDQAPSLLLSGINAGPNHGDALCFSGTVGAALTGLMLGIPSIAISQRYTMRDNIPWATSRQLVPQLLRYFLTEGWKKETCLSINIPDQPASAIANFQWARQAPKTIARLEVSARTSPGGQDYAWINFVPTSYAGDAPDSDRAVLNRERVAVSALTLDRSVEVLKPAVRFEDPTATTKKDA